MATMHHFLNNYYFTCLQFLIVHLYSNVTATVLSSKQILVTWGIVPPVDQNGVITMYKVLYYSTLRPMLTKNVAGLAVNLTGLEESDNYSISVCAYTSRGMGPYSESIWTTTTTSN